MKFLLFLSLFIIFINFPGIYGEEHEGIADIIHRIQNFFTFLCTRCQEVVMVIDGAIDSQSLKKVWIFWFLGYGSSKSLQFCVRCLQNWFFAVFGGTVAVFCAFLRKFSNSGYCSLKSPQFGVRYLRKRAKFEFQDANALCEAVLGFNEIVEKVCKSVGEFPMNASALYWEIPFFGDFLAGISKIKVLKV